MGCVRFVEMDQIAIPSVEATANLWLKIDQLHLNFIMLEESTKKLDVRKKLESYVRQYLCVVPQDRKFCDLQTSDIIVESAKVVPNFSASRAAHAFEALETYATNLIKQPWRQEFRQIKQYGGFFKHKLESALYDPVRIFLQMGYCLSDPDCLILDGAIDQDMVTTVARDCLLALVECKILSQVGQGLRAANFVCDWAEIVDFRVEHVGTPQQAVRAIGYLKHQANYNYSETLKGQSIPSYPQQAVTGTLVDISPTQEVPIPLTVKHLEEESQWKSRLNDGSPCNGKEKHSSEEDRHQELIRRLVRSRLDCDETDAIHRRMKSNSTSGSGDLGHQRSLRHSRPLEPPTQHRGQSQRTLPNPQKTWRCHTCGAINVGPNERACSSCHPCDVPRGNSRRDDRVADVNDVIACHLCTLVNVPDAVKCEACNAELIKKTKRP